MGVEILGRAGNPGDGPYVVLGLRVAAGRVFDVSAECNGCPAAQRATYGLAGFARGRTLEQLSRMDASDLLVLVGGLPDGKGFYADLVVQALHDVLARVAAGSDQ